MSEKITGSEALMRALSQEKVDTIFGYPGGTIMPVYDAIFDYEDKIHHILMRHEQGAIHAAEGYARVTGKTGVVIVTSGPGASNLVTGIADAYMDSTPLVVIAGQVSTEVLGSDAFQETDFIDVTNPLSKWGIQVRSAEEIPDILARAFFIANSGRPGPVVIDLPRNAQVGEIEWKGYEKCNFIRTYVSKPTLDHEKIKEAAELLNNAKRPLILAGRGVIVSQAEGLVKELAEKANIPVATTLLGLSILPTNHPLNKGMLGMHGNIGPNIATNRADVILGVGLRFDDRVTGNVSKYAPDAKIIHIEIDQSELDRRIKSSLSILGDASEALTGIIPLVVEKKQDNWGDLFEKCDKIEHEKVDKLVISPSEDSPMHMAEVIKKVSDLAGDDAILVTDVGQNQMTSVRYFEVVSPNSVITSGGLGTMGFGIPAAIGAKIGTPKRTVCLFCGDGGFQMTEQELGTIMQYGVNVKIIILNNNFLGNVRQWQELFFNKRYSQTPMLNPDFKMISEAYGIEAEDVVERKELPGAVERMMKSDKAYILNVNIDPYEMVFPMIAPGAAIDDIMLNKTEKLDVEKL